MCNVLRQKIKKSLIIILISLLLVVASAAGYYYFSIKQKNNGSGEAKIVEIRAGESNFEIASDIKNTGAINSASILWLFMEINHKSINPGFYSIPYGLSISDLVGKILDDDLTLYKVTVTEGRRIEQIAASLDDHGYYRYRDFVVEAKGLEGKLFPDTYYAYKKGNAKDLVNMMHDNYLKKVQGLNIADKDLILASIVERETKKDDERAIVAGVYQNRLNAGIKLQADPTVIYAFDSAKLSNMPDSEVKNYSFWEPVPLATFSGVKSPYNTYLVDGLPPAPICNPGISSIKAAQNPAKHDYLYFFHDSSGQIYLSKTAAEHEAKVEQYLK